MSIVDGKEEKAMSPATASVQAATRSRKRPIPLVITSIKAATDSVRSFAKIRDSQFMVVVIGDRKSPPSYGLKEVVYLGIEDQVKAFPGFAEALPFDSYSRKNLGYLYAMQTGCEVIVETDDDNRPCDNFPFEWRQEVSGCLVDYEGWGNVYGLFTKHKVWPRGLPLDCIDIEEPLSSSSATCVCPIQQYLADGDPDVDAIYRLVGPQKRILFDRRTPVILASGSFCPFNSQNTVWFPEVYELMYLPSHVSFRMTDVWRSFVAQICLHAVGMNLSFHSSTVCQDRNAHDLMRDFSDEIPGYLHNRRIVDTLLSLHLSPRVTDMGSNLLQCWQALCRIDLVPGKEIDLCESWLKEVNACREHYLHNSTRTFM